MSFKTSLIRTAIKWTPKTLVLWVGNIVLRGIATLTDFQLDLDNRTAFIRTQLQGEAEPIEIWLDNFTLLQDGENYHFMVSEARSNKVWLTNLLDRFTGKAWKIPEVPQLKPHLGLAAELLKPKN
jgi:hypothetical protein